MTIPSQRKAERRNLVVLAVDIRRFSAYTDTERTRIASVFRDAIEESFISAGLEHVWQAREFCQNQGDGLVVGFAEEHLSAIVDGLPRALQNQLRELDRRELLNIRMRLGVAAGPVQGVTDDRIDVAPNQTIIDACRVGDAKAPRMLLENSDENATYLAVAVTSTVVTGTIAPDPGWLCQSEFVKVPIDMTEKDYHTEAYLHVPSPSGDLLRFGLSNLPASQRSEAADFEPLEELIRMGLNELRPTATIGRTTSTETVGRDRENRSVKAEGNAIAAGENSRIHQDNSRNDHRHQDRSVRQAGRDIVSSGRDSVVRNTGADDERHPFWETDQ